MVCRRSGRCWRRSCSRRRCRCSRGLGSQQPSCGHPHAHPCCHARADAPSTHPHTHPSACYSSPNPYTYPHTSANYTRADPRTHTGSYHPSTHPSTHPSCNYTSPHAHSNASAHADPSRHAGANSDPGRHPSSNSDAGRHASANSDAGSCSNCYRGGLWSSRGTGACFSGCVPLQHDCANLDECLSICRSPDCCRRITGRGRLEPSVPML